MYLITSSSVRLPRAYLLALALLITALLLSPLAWAETPIQYDGPIESGHSAMWYDTSRDGEGWMLEVLPDDAAVVYWFTFDDDGKPRWLVGTGNIMRGETGDEIRFDELLAVHGPQFGPNYDPADAVFESVGSAQMRFASCNSGMVEFDAYGRQGSFPLSRLTQTMGAGCRPIHGTPGEPVQPYAGQSGSWFDPAFDGQGFSLEWMSNGSAALVWFTFDPHGQPYWLTAVGEMEAERLLFPELLAVQGGRFADPFDPEAVQYTPWGSIEMSLDCDVGDASFVSNESGFIAGSFQLRHLTRLLKPACPWVKPKLTDLYDLELTELPAMPQAPPWPGDVVSADPGAGSQVRSVANDGSVVGVRNIPTGEIAPYQVRNKAVRLRPGESNWSDVDDSFVVGKVFASASGDEVLINRQTEGPVYIRDGAVMPIPSLASAARAEVMAASDDLSFVAGRADMRLQSGAHTWKYWVWDRTKDQLSELSADDVEADIVCVSNDGETVIGGERYMINTPYNPPASLRWVGSEPPHHLTNADGEVLVSPRACSGDGSIVYGFWQITEDEEPLEPSFVPGFWTASGTGAHLAPLSASEDDPLGWPQWVSAVSSDGSFEGGAYRSPEMINSLPNKMSAKGGLLWTQDTGHEIGRASCRERV